MSDTPIKSIRLDEKRWLTIYNDIAKTRPASWLIIRNTMKSKLGFLNRSQSVWIEKEHRVKRYVFLDFYDDKKKTMFILKYGPFDKLENN